MTKKVQNFPIWHIAHLMPSRFFKQLRRLGRLILIWLRVPLIMWIALLNIYAGWPTTAACLTYDDMWTASAKSEQGCVARKPSTLSWRKTLRGRMKQVKPVKTYKSALCHSGVQWARKVTTGNGRR